MTRRALVAPARLAGQPILRTQSDERLVDLVRAGHDPAFEAIVARYRRALLGHARRIVPGERAEDVVQQAFLRAYEAMRAGGAELNLRPWLFRIAHNTALNALRDRALRHERLHDSLDGVERSEQTLERREGLRDALAAVRALPGRQRDAIVLRELEGRSYEEIAAALGVSGGAVRQLLSRARTTLRAGATAVTPGALVGRIPWAAPSEGIAGRVADLCGMGGGALAAKACAGALVAGALVGGVAVAPHGARAPEPRPAHAPRTVAADALTTAARPAARATRATPVRGHGAPRNLATGAARPIPRTTPAEASPGRSRAPEHARPAGDERLARELPAPSDDGLDPRSGVGSGNRETADERSAGPDGGADGADHGEARPPSDRSGHDGDRSSGEGSAGAGDG